MIRLLLILLFTSGATNLIFAQDKYFHELRGFEDSTGTTHLFYRVLDSEARFVYTNHVYHLNTESNLDSLLFEEQYFENPHDTLPYDFVGVSEFHFLENDVNRLIYLQINQFDHPVGPYSSIYQKLIDWDGDEIAKGGHDGQVIGSAIGIPSKLNDRIIINYLFGNEVFQKGTNIDTTLTLYDASEDFENALHIVADWSETEQLVAHRNDTLFILDDNFEIYARVKSPFNYSYYDYSLVDFYFPSDSSTFYFRRRTRNKYSTSSVFRVDILNVEMSVQHITPSRSQNGFAINQTDNSSIAYSDSTVVLYSNDRGDTFETLITMSEYVTGLYFNQNQQLYILTKEHLYKYDLESEELTSILDLPTSNEVSGIDIPNTIILHQNYPNPFNPTTNIWFALQSDSYVTLTVYDQLGREVQVLFDEYLLMGNHVATFNANNLSSGIYYYTIEAVDLNQRATKKMTLIK